MTSPATVRAREQVGRGAAEIMTPALVIDLAAMQRNLATTAAHAAAAGCRLRPPAKTHKGVEIAQRQVAAGAVWSIEARGALV